MKKIINLSEFVPNAKLDDYYFRMYNDVPDRCNNGFVGCVGNVSNPKINIEIEIDNVYMAENNQASCCLWGNSENIYQSEIIMTGRYFDEFRKNEFLQFVLWHEIGHFHTMHYFKTVFNENGSAQKVREEYLERGEIMPEEKVADLVGLYYTSKQDALKFFTYAIERRRSFTWEAPDVTSRAIRELILRKRYIRQLDESNDSIKEEICRLCGVDNFDLL